MGKNFHPHSKSQNKLVTKNYFPYINNKQLSSNIIISLQRMLNTISGGCLLPRDVIQWLDGLDLSYSVRNPKMDLANGFTIAEILTRKYPNELSILTFYNAQAKDKKYNNWEQLKKFLTKKSFKITNQQIDSIINVQLQTAQSLLFRIYQLCTGRKLNIDRRLSSTLPQPQQPLYKKPTASYVAKDRQLQRIIDKNQKQFRTKTFISKHQNHIHSQKYNTGLIQWLIEKRKTQIHKQVQRQRTQLQNKTRKFQNTQQKIEVKQIQLKCFNSSTSKKNKGEYGDFMDSKGVIEFLTESCSLLFKRETIANDLKKLGIELRQKQISNLTIIQQLFHRSSQLDQKGHTKLSPQTLNRILQQFKKTSQLNLIMENINSNFLDYKKFINLFEKPLNYYSKDSETFKLIVGLLTTVAKGLHQKYNSQNAEMMFYQLGLGVLTQVGQNQHKRPVIASLILDFVRKQSQCYSQLIQKLKQHSTCSSRIFTSYLALFIDKIAKQCDDIQYNLWSEFFYHGFQAIHNSSPTTRVNGTKIISKLFTDVIVVSSEMVTEKLPILQKLIVDPWWQVRAQAIIIFKSILMSKFKNQSSSEESLNQDLNTKTIEHYINQIFKPDVSHNILRIGLIQLAELLMVKQTFCARYLQILLHVGPQIRTDVLTTSIIKFGPVVYGANTYNYQLTGAPLVWNALGIATQLNNYIKKHKIQAFELSHLEILYACMNKNITIANNGSEWLNLYEQMKSMIFEAFLEEDLCGIALSIVKEFLSVREIHADILKVSRGEVTGLLSTIFSYTLIDNVYCLGSNRQQIKSNILNLLTFLKDQQAQYTYKIMKDFAEREKAKYLQSNLIDFMNELSRERRKLIFNE